MRAAVTRWFVGALVIAGAALVIPTAVLAAEDIQKHERQLQTDVKQLDADAERASSTPEGQRRLNDRLAKQFNVDPKVVTNLRERHFSYGQATIALALSQQLMKDKKLSQQDALDKIMAERQAGRGWGVIAHDLGLKLGQVVSDVKKADKAAEHVAGKPSKDQNMAKVDKPDKIEKADRPDKPEKLAKPEKPGR